MNILFRKTPSPHFRKLLTQNISTKCLHHRRAAMSNSSLNPKSASESASSMVEREKALRESELVDKPGHKEEDTEKKMSSSPVPPCNASSQNPKSEASASAGSMDEQEKALGEQQGHEEDTEKKISSSPDMRETSKSASESAGSMDEVEKSLEDLELLDTQQHGHEEAEKVIICYGKKVLEQLLRDEMDNVYLSAPLAHQRSLKLVSTLNTLGYACLDMKLYDESLRYFNWSYKKLNELLEDGGGGGGSSSPVLDCLIRTHCGLFKVKMAMERKEDAPRHMKKVLDIKEKTMEEGCLGLGEAYKELYKAYLELRDSEEALPYCLKALDIYIRHTDLEKYDLALEHYLLATSVLECATDEGGKGSLMAEVFKAYVLSQSGRHDEAVDALKVVISRGAETLDAEGRVMAFTGMAIALCGQEKTGEARNYMEAARVILDTKEMDAPDVAGRCWDLALLYKKIKDFKTAMYLLRKALKTPELRKDDLLNYYRGFYLLVYGTGSFEEELTHLEDAMERLKGSFGPKHIELGYVNCDLGIAYMNVHRRHEAVKYLEKSKEILDASLGPRHIAVLKISQTLSNAYALAGRYDLAIPCQEKVVEGLKAAGTSEQENLIEAVGLLRAMQSANMVFGVAR